MAPTGLTTPDPPDRVIVPVTVPETVEPAPAPPPAVSIPARPVSPPAARPERTAPAPAVPPAISAAPEPAAPTPPPTLQMTSNPGEVEQRALALMAAARRDLDRINPALLSANARAQYTAAKGFVRQAEDALRIRNVVLARELADKAASLASQLARL